ncbi:MAG: hypothetical protein FD152_2489 [Xanthobacteraceae bacterium]|nr:MAG: hypothetical protein FD152_2489 [Xanthobacteraceae bacterium]
MGYLHGGGSRFNLEAAARPPVVQPSTHLILRCERAQRGSLEGRTPVPQGISELQGIAPRRLPTGRTPSEPLPYALSVPPVFLVTSATIFAATASISASVNVLSFGCSVTAIATDFFASSMPLPS